MADGYTPGQLAESNKWWGGLTADAKDAFVASIIDSLPGCHRTPGSPFTLDNFRELLRRYEGITPEGLVELVDASERFDLAPLTVKLAEIAVEGRHLRVFETGDPNLLLVKEKKGPLHEDYAIERDEGLVADLKLYAQMP